ncbi:hypothetical protein M406DRAFT_329493 [Cryphonectria parasitica EP155]|uniref:Uncharacterized protein n=1 Tax=Cryphonectria parasitica (strain ATCC 38755 / EP155) TaxID=660469 RepID=A0A9P5CQ28_CRYP1|nr:uncharacterized protein M406DRAFT_329493 [Cryphonectria parasitica EP155]KAF3765605.1 hypothetical protein M406DRAFT_329493 [Cryphonectria parasitica EP155]
MANSTGMSSAAKVGIAIAAAFGIVLLFSLGLYLWWRQREKKEMAKGMINFVDGDIVTLVDRGRFEKPSKPNYAYDPYYESGSSSQSFQPAPQYYQAPSNYTLPPVEGQNAHYAAGPASASTNYTVPLAEGHNGYYAPGPAPSAPSVSPHASSQDMPSPSESNRVVPPPPATVADSNAWANTGRHPWSPPDYEVHFPVSASSLQPDYDFSSHAQQREPMMTGNRNSTYAIAGLPAILPEPKPNPQAELPAREGHHGWGHEQELPAPQQAPLKRQPPPQGAEIEEQKFLLADIIPLRQKKSRPDMPGPAG